MSKVGIVSVIYTESYWKRTQFLIKKLGVPTVFVDRDGTGSLAAAYNLGFDELIKRYDVDYVWFVSNVEFTDSTLQVLQNAMDSTGYDIIHPCFVSDHLFCRCNTIPPLIKEVPFVEFTSPIVRVDTFAKLRLDEQMPYWGHDFDFGHRVREQGGVVAVHHGVSVKHTYIRHNVKLHPHSDTVKRQQLRKDTNESTKARLRELYGAKWSEVIKKHGF